MSQSAVTNDILESRTLKLRKAINLWCCHRFCSLMVPSGRLQQPLGVWLSLTPGCLLPCSTAETSGLWFTAPMAQVVTGAKVQRGELSFHLWFVTGRIFPSGFDLSTVKQLLIFSCTASQTGEKLSHLYSWQILLSLTLLSLLRFPGFTLVSFYSSQPKALVRRGFNVTQNYGRARKETMGDAWGAGLPVLGRGWSGLLLSKSFWIMWVKEKKSWPLSHKLFF